ncbi:hypothetical protein B9J78_06330 [bacterium Unc6]|nr:hypothetical protein [bacterium Unc6]
MKKAFTLIEVMLSILILAIVIIGGAFFFIHGPSQIRVSKRERLALELAEEKIEVSRVRGFSGLVNESESGLALGRGFTATRLTVVAGIDEDRDGIIDYKNVTVTVSWMERGTPREVNLTTLITSR